MEQHDGQLVLICEKISEHIIAFSIALFNHRLHHTRMRHRISPVPHRSDFMASVSRIDCNTIPRKLGYRRPTHLHSQSRHARTGIPPVGRIRSERSRRQKPHPGFRRPSSRSRRQCRPANVLPHYDGHIASHEYTPQALLAGVLWELVRLGLVPWEKVRLEQAPQALVVP